ncbi:MULTISPECIES: FTR1 family iron permease [unclassified Candidatus Tisiphia]|uniref:FTR1 family iron permease n=1 Tax=unclassified Candidatus Tisiphia TaxID=2996318 RepID=UPI001E7C02FD|nr:MAG: FTR1 family protein [Rickettsia endosymbiont of Cimex lectularius]
MFKIALVVFRECLEIALLLGVILAVTKQLEKSRIYIIAGVMLGTVSAALFAFFTRSITVAFSGLGDEIFNSGIILLTVALIGWTIVWMQGYGIKIKQNLNDLSVKISSGDSSYIMLVLIVAATILREGMEIIILVYSISSVEIIDSNSYLLGLIIGIVSGLTLGVIIYLGLIKIVNQQYIFRISSILLMLVASGFAAEAAGILSSSGIITILSDQLWDSSWLISDRSIYGKFLKMITGYIARPNGLQVVFYVCTLGLINILIQIKIRHTKAVTEK